MIDTNAVVLLLAATIALAAPLLFAALGELISERAGILNINLEAMMLGGAFCGVWVASVTASLFAGFVGAALAGINIRLVRWTALLTCGALAGIGGGQLTLAGLGTFTQNVTAGRGFIALAAVVFGRWTPSGAMVAILLFTTIESLQVRAQILGIN